MEATLLHFPVQTHKTGGVSFCYFLLLNNLKDENLPLSLRRPYFFFLNFLHFFKVSSAEQASGSDAFTDQYWWNAHPRNYLITLNYYTACYRVLLLFFWRGGGPSNPNCNVFAVVFFYVHLNGERWFEMQTFWLSDVLKEQPTLVFQGTTAFSIWV